MNKEIIKVMNGKNTESIARLAIKTWWKRNNYKVLRVLCFPVWIGMIIKDKYNIYMNKKQVWSEARAQEILNYYVPRRFEYDKNDKTFYYFDNGYGWNIKHAKKFLKRKDRRFWKIYSGIWGGQIRSFMINKFELEGFIKNIGDCTDGYTEIWYTSIK